jgi:hypothetical protein
MKKNKPLDIGFIDKMVVNAAMNKIDQTGMNIEAMAKENCPVKDGNLRSSGNKIRDDSKFKIYIGFGKGISKKYAVFQHENVGLYHKVGKAKFLQDAFDICTKGMYTKSELKM